MSDNDQVEEAGLCFPPLLYRFLWGKEVEGRKRKRVGEVQGGERSRESGEVLPT